MTDLHQTLRRPNNGCADKYAGMPAMDAKLLTDMELLVLVSGLQPKALRIHA